VTAIPEATGILLRTFVAVCLGALVGLERQVAGEEREEKDFPGVRTFAFLALTGALSVLIAERLDPLVAVALFLATAAFLVLRYRFDAQERGDPGYTTEVASLCTFVVGALAQSGLLLVATVVSIAMVALLRSKLALHRAAELLSPADMTVLIRFLVITGIVLPLLPDDPYGPFEVLRPRDVWRMVVLISALSFAGYVLVRLRAAAGSWLLMGALGGLVSSTATAVAYARAARQRTDARALEALVVLAAATAFLRIAVEIGVVATSLLPRVLLPLAAMFAVGIAAAAFRHRPARGPAEPQEYENPLTMRTALTFAAIYAAVLLAAAAAEEYLSAPGLYAVTALAGTVGADAPTLSLARLSGSGLIAPETAARGIVLVAIATTLGKAAIALVVARGGPFARRVVPTLLAMAAAGAVALPWL
jgi:uncharacterized membrane protein (DUF4010 family)